MFLFFITLAIYDAKKKKDILHPLIIYVFPLFMQYILYVALYKSDNNIDNKTIVIYMLSIIFYMAGFLIGEKIFFPKSKKMGREIKYEKGTLTVLVCTIFFIVSAIAIMSDIYKVTGFKFEEFYRKMRVFINYGDGYSFFAKYFPVFYNVFYLLYAYTFFKERIKGTSKKIVFCVLSFIYVWFSLVSFARTSILQSLFAILYLVIEIDEERNSSFIFTLEKYALRILVFFVLLFTAFSIIAAMTYKLGSQTIFSRDFFLWKYIGYPIVAMDKHMTHYPGASSGYFTFGIVGKILKKLGVIGSGFESLLAGSRSFNVYTYIGNLWMDFGIVSFILQFFLGILISYMYAKCKKCQGSWMIFFSCYCFAIITSFYGYNYSLTVYIYIAICLIAIRMLNKVKVKI